MRALRNDLISAPLRRRDRLAEGRQAHDVELLSWSLVNVAMVTDTKDRDGSFALVDSIQDPVTPAVGNVDAGELVAQLASDATGTTIHPED